MTIAAVIVALVFAFLAFKFVKGVIKFGILAAIGVVLVYFLARGGGLG